MKLLLSDHPDYMRVAYELGITGIVLPELDAAFAAAQHNPHHQYTVGEHLMQSLLHTRADKSLRLAALCMISASHPSGRPMRMESTISMGMSR